MQVRINGRVTLMDPVLNCTGYRAEEIFLDSVDLKKLAQLNDRDLVATVRQLAGRTF